MRSKSRLTNEQREAAHIKRRDKNNKFRAQIKGSHTEADLVEILAKQNNRCVYCDADFREVAKQKDHIIPIVPRPGYRRGTNDKSNIQFLCKPCNKRKGSKDPDVFARELNLNSSLHQSLLAARGGRPK